MGKSANQPFSIDCSIFNEHGRTFAFDHRAKSGFARGEGTAALILKPLDQAVRDNDKIRSVIVNSGINQDGKTVGTHHPCSLAPKNTNQIIVGLSTPSGEAQEQLMRDVYARVNISPSDTAYVEAHGTGTKVGDPIEATAIKNVFSEGRTKRAPLYMGSVKTNVGHMENASGLVSIIKSAMMLEKGFILPNVNFEKANPAIPLDEWNMKVPTTIRPWPRNKRYISVNNFGFGGSNAHVVLERGPINIPKEIETETRTENIRLIVLSGHDEKAAKRAGKQLGVYLEQHPEIFQKRLMRDVSYTLGERRTHHAYRIAIPATSFSDLATSLNGVAALPTRASAIAPTLAFVFTGQGAQWPQMGKELMNSHKVFNRTVTKASDYLLSIGAEFSLVDELLKPKEESIVGQAHISQPICTAVQLGLIELLASFGIKPSMVIGHSSGEMGAAYAAGALSMEHAMAAAYYRGQAAVEIKQKHPNLRGAMLAVGAGPEEVKAIIKSLGLSGVTVACENSPNSITASGDEAAVDALAAELESRSMFNRKLRVDVAYHSAHMELTADEYMASIQHVHAQPTDGAVKFYSSLCGRKVQDTGIVGAQYWVDNLTKPVLFSSALKNLYEDGKPDVIVELGPHAALEGPIKQILKDISSHAATNTKYFSVLMRNQNASQTALKLAGNLFCRGLSIDFEAVNQTILNGQKAHVIADLAPYPFSEHSYWYESRTSKQHRLKPFGRHDLLGLLEDAYNEAEPTWRNTINTDDIPWLKDHRMQSLPTFPLAGYLSMAVEAVYQRNILRGVAKDQISGYRLREIQVTKAFILEEGAQYETSVSFNSFAEGTRSYSNDWDEFRISSWAPGRGWLEHCRGLIGIKKSGVRNLVSDRLLQAALERRQVMDKAASTLLDYKTFYEELEARGAGYTGSFAMQPNGSLKVHGQYSAADVFVPETVSQMPHTFEADAILRTSFIDIFFQLTYAILGAGSANMKTLFMPSAIKELEISSRVPNVPGDRVHVVTHSRRAGTTSGPVDFFIDAWHADHAEPVVKFTGYRKSPVNGDSSDSQGVRELCYQLDWVPLKPKVQTTHAASNGYTNGNGHANGNGFTNGNGHANGHVHVNGNGHANGQAHDNGNGRANGNGCSNGHHDHTTNGKANGNGHAANIVNSNGHPNGISKDVAHVNGNGHVIPEAEINGNGHPLKNNGNAKPPIEKVDVKEIEASHDFVPPPTMVDLSESPISLITAGGQATPLGDALADLLELRTGGYKPNYVSLESADFSSNTRFICLAEVDAPILQGMNAATFEHTKSLLLNSMSTLWISRGAYRFAENPWKNIAQGLLRTVRSEANKAAAMLDLDPKSELKPADQAELIVEAMKASLAIPEDGSPVHFEFAEENGVLVVPSVTEQNDMNLALFRETQASEPYLQEFIQPGRRFALSVGTYGALDSIYWKDEAELPLSENEVEIKVAATGMNFKDVVIAMGQVASPYIGIECAGTIARVGSGVTSLKVGDRVCAMTLGAYSTYARCLDTSAAVIPDDMSFETAASIPVVYCTAYYGLMDLARLEAGEKILIHAASGGVGQAAIQLAQMVGAEIFATVGSMDKKQYLMTTYGIAADHIFYSRDTSFGPEIREATGGKGVDVVINSLAGDLLRETWDCLAPFGRFIEIGKRDITSNTRLEMSKFEYNCTFSSVDLTLVAAERPKIMGRSLSAVLELLSKKSVNPIGPITTVSIAEIESALRKLQSGKTTGKVVVNHEVNHQVKAIHAPPPTDLLKKDATYIIIGGTGGLGRSMAKRMVERGAGNIVLLSRSGKMTPELQQLADESTAAGAAIHVRACDVAIESQVRELITDLQTTLPPVMGVIHAAMVLRDVLFEKMTFEDYDAVVCSKIAGAWNFHNALLSSPLDFFIVLSSVAGIIGNRGQAAYAAANTYLDALTFYRKSKGLKSTSLNLTAVSGVGYLAENAAKQAEVLKNLSGSTIGEAEVLALMEASISGKTVTMCNDQVITGLDFGEPANLPYYASDAKFAPLRTAALAKLSESEGDGASVNVSISQQMRRSTTVDEAQELVTVGLRDKLGAILMLPEEVMIAQQDSTTITAFGLDSLNAIELRNWIGKELQCHLQVLELLTSGNLKDLAGLVLRKTRIQGVWTKKEEGK